MWPTPSAASYGSNRGGGAGRVGPIRASLATLVKEWPTPTVHGNYNAAGASTKAGDGLSTAVTLNCPTPVASDEKGPSGENREGGGRLCNALGVKVRTALNPAWVETLMGAPVGWTDVGGLQLKVSPRFRGSRRASKRGS